MEISVRRKKNTIMLSVLITEFPNYHILLNMIQAVSPPKFSALSCLDQIL